MKKYLKLISALAVTGMLLTGCGGSDDETLNDNTDNQNAQEENTGATDNGAVQEHVVSTDPYAITHTGTMTVVGLGDIKFELYGNIAPITVENFVNLAQDGFYDGLTIHRVLPGFVIQGGDPNGDGTGGSSDPIKGEFKANNVENPLLHTRGVLSMARSNDVNSASSQFFIMHADASHLDGMYAGFGMVTAGMDVVDAITKYETDASDKPLEDVIIQSIKISQ